MDRIEKLRLLKEPGVTIVGTTKEGLTVGIETKMISRKLFHKLGVTPAIARIIETGPIVALQARTDKWRPAPGGVSIGHHEITAGTLGAVVKKDGRKLILSNNHVLANSNDAKIGDAILQPGPHDGGSKSDKIAVLHSFVPIHFSGGGPGNWFERFIGWIIGCIRWVVGKIIAFFRWLFDLFSESTEEVMYNRVDAALALPLNEADVRDDILDIGVPTQFGEAKIGDKVVKSGRTTGFTHSIVDMTDAYVSVGYGGGKRAYFEDQIVTGNMLSGGDSGSLLLKADKQTVVGLCFAGSNERSIMNKISNVREELGGFEWL